jgi:hypothetical protein
MASYQLLEVVGKHVQPSGGAVVAEMTLREAEELLDWIENQGCPPALLLTRPARSRIVRETNTAQPAIEWSDLRALSSCCAEAV